MALGGPNRPRTRNIAVEMILLSIDPWGLFTYRIKESVKSQSPISVASRCDWIVEAQNVCASSGGGLPGTIASGIQQLPLRQCIDTDLARAF